MVKDELQELINGLNQRHGSLRKWEAWNTVLAAYDDKTEAWDIRMEFLGGRAHRCLYKPSSIRDTFTLLATNSMHQVAIASDSQYIDSLLSDPAQASSLGTSSVPKTVLGILLCDEPLDGFFTLSANTY